MIDIHHIREIMELCVECGYQQAQRDIEPQSDRCRKKEAIEILRRRGLPSTLLSRLEDEGLIVPHKGKANSPIWYSLIELKKALATTSLIHLFNNN